MMFNDQKRILMKAKGNGGSMTSPLKPEVPEPFLSFLGMTVPSEGVMESQIVQDLQQLAEKFNLKLRIWLPNSVGTMEYKISRLNVRLTKLDDNSLEISAFNRG